jgi:hypothetical protein
MMVLLLELRLPLLFLLGELLGGFVDFAHVVVVCCCCWCYC